MNPTDIGAMLRAQEQILVEAQRRKGQKPTNKASRLLLQMSFAPQKVDPKMSYVKHSFMSIAYPPSTSTLAELMPIDMSMLRLETHHRGKVLVVRTFVDPLHIQAFQTAIEDEYGAVDRLALYNEDPTTAPAKVLPKGAIFAIKEPYYKGSADGGYTIRVDHPSDLVILHPGHDLIPLALALQNVHLGNSVTKRKESGNEAYLKRDYLGAVENYTQGLGACEDDNLALRCDLFRNRAAANLSLARYECALEDAEAAMIPESFPNSAQMNTKTHGRAARAAYALRNWESADAHYLQALILNPDDKDFLKARMRIADRLNEANSGSYDFKTISDSLGDKGSHLDHADFLSNTEVRPAGNRGRGLFATKALKAGDLIFCEKAFALRFRPESMNNVLTIVNFNTKRLSIGPQAMLFSDVVQDLRHNPKRAARSCDLYDGGYEPKGTLQQLDGVVVLEDLMIVHASRDIAEDEEIYISYSFQEAHYKKMKDHLRAGWAFDCDCKICVAESKSSAQSRSRRQMLVQETSVLLTANQQTASVRASKEAITKVEQLYEKLNAIYDDKIFTKNVPRLGLYVLSAWLCQAHRGRAATSKLVAYGMAPLKDLAFSIIVKGDSATFNRSTGMVAPIAIAAAIFVANAYFSMGKKRLAKEFHDFAKGMYVILYGELRGFVEQYGESAHRASRLKFER